jgi:HAD superfamily hydrolase (TIGR01490 family)
MTLPGIGEIGVHNDTRRLRRMLAKDRAKILFATVSHHAGRWWVSLNVEAADLHLAVGHPARNPGDEGGWVGVDRGLTAFAVAAEADGTEVARVEDAPKALAAGLRKQRRLAKSLSRKEIGSRNRRDAAAKLGRHHHRVANMRRHFLHQVSNALVKTHDRLVIEDLNISGMMANRRLARAISDAGWAEFARQLGYKQAWRGGELVVADRRYPSSRLCPQCGAICGGLTLADRVFTCDCGYSADRDCNAAANLARWADGADHHPRVPVKPARMTREPTFTPHQRLEPTIAREGRCRTLNTELADTLKVGWGAMSVQPPAADPIAEIAASPSGPQVGAFFDLDGTLVDGFTATAHASDRIRRRQARVGEVLGVIEASMRYRLGRMRFEHLLTRAAGYLRGESLTDLDALGERLFVERVAARVFPAMHEIVQAHQARGHTVVLSSSALTIHAEPVARFLEIDHVLCNHFELDDDGRLTGRVARPVVWGRNKASVVQHFCEGNDVDLQRSYFYADGNEDAALMKLVGLPRPVNPRPGLAATAAEHGWPVLQVTGSGRRRRRSLRRLVGYD